MSAPGQIARPGVARRVARRLRLLPRDFGYGYGPWLMSRLRKWWVLARHPHADIRFTEPVYLGPGFSLHVPERASFIVGPGVEFRRNFRAELAAGATITIGAGTRFTYDPVLQCGDRIEIGSGCWIGQATMLVDGDHRFRDPGAPVEQQGFDLHPLVLEDEVMIYSKATVVGVRIGRRGIVAANAVAVKDVPAFTLVGGIPARVIEEFGAADESGARS
jgi:acetyltransferase-like isoleucine patch superfamily enzyme